MLTTITLAIAALLAGVGLLTAILAKPAKTNDDPPWRGLGLTVFALFAVIFGAVFLLNSVKLVGANEVGVKVTFGSVDQKPLASGMHWVAPWTEVETLPTRPKTFTVVAQTRSSENGIISTRLSARWATDKANAADLYLQVRTGDEKEIESALLAPNMVGAAGAYLGDKTNLDIINGKNWVANGAGIEGVARTYLSKYGVAIDTVRIVEETPDKDTDANIRRASAQVVETNIAKQANLTAIAQAARNLTEANGNAAAANAVKGLTAEQVQLLCLQAAERLMNKNTEKGIPTYVLPCGAGDVRTTTTVK